MSDVLRELLPVMVGAAIVPLYPILVTAFKKWRKEEDVDDPLPKWMSDLSHLSGLQRLALVGSLNLWIALLFPAWVLLVSVYVLIQNHRGQMLVAPGR